MTNPDTVSPPDDLSPEAFEGLVGQLGRVISDYLGNVEHRPVVERVVPGAILDALPELPPVEPGGLGVWDEIIEDLNRIIIPGLTHWQHPSFFGYFPANASGPAILGELVSAGLGVQGMLWATSPACTELEIRVLDWMACALGLPQCFRSTSKQGGGVIQGTASEATLVALVAARRRALDRLGVLGRPDQQPRLTLYASTQAHSSVVKAAMIAGLADTPGDTRAVRLIETDRDGAMLPGALARAISDDRASGREPFFLTLTVGTTGSTAIDSIVDLTDAARDAGFDGWIHVDAAYAGAACVCEEFRWMLAGVDRCDSLCVNPHKWLLTNFDCDLFWTRDRAALVASLAITPEYLRNEASEAGGVIDYRDWQVPLGRRFRALKLWFVMRHYGLAGLAQHIRHHVALARWFEAWVDRHELLELAAPRTVALVCFGLCPLPGASTEATNARHRALLERINETGKVFLTHAMLPGGAGKPDRFVLRMAIGGTHTTMDQVRAAAMLIGEQAGKV